MVSETKTSVLEQVLIKLMVTNPENGDRVCLVCGDISDADDRVPEYHETDCLLVQARVAAPRLKAVNEALLEALKRLYAPKTTRMMISRPQCQRGRRLGAPSLWPRRSHER